MKNRKRIAFLALFLSLQTMDHSLFAKEANFSQLDSKKDAEAYLVTLDNEDSFDDLSDSWAVSLFQHMMNIRVFSEEGQNVDFAATLSGIKKMTNPITDLQTNTSKLHVNSFTEEELSFAKSAAFAFLNQIEEEWNNPIQKEDSEVLRNLAFIKQSVQCLENIEMSKIDEVLSMLQPSDQYHISTAPTELHANDADFEMDDQFYHEYGDLSEVMETLEAVKDKNERAEISLLDAQDPYQTLIVQKWEIDTIRKIINTMGEKNVVQLLLKKKELKKMGKKIHHVHPLKFLEIVFSNSKSAHSMREVRKNSFKWDAFIDGLSEKLHDESKQNNVLPYVKGFCETLHLDYDRVLHFISHHEWKHLVQYLIDRS